MKQYLKSTNNLINLAATSVAMAIALIAITSSSTSALSGSQFQAGRIIDDAVFYNSNSMTSAQIQQFLESKLPACDTNGAKPYNGTTRASYGTNRGYPPPYTCLKDYRQNINAKNPEDLLCNGMSAANNILASEIIYRVAQSCGVSPKVLIILLEKEQSLVTDDWPWSIQYRSATGYGCPDTAPCDAEYYGFFNQVYNAARIYKYYAKYPNSFNHVAGRNNYVLYNPNHSCGGTNVLIQNQATAGLYNYTPYQPNVAALNNLYGTGDGCSAYGNRNFWRLFNDWFGSTTGFTDYSWSVVSQKAFTNSSKNTQIPNYSPTLKYKERAFFEIKVRNEGNTVWNKSVRIGTSNISNRSSQFCDPSWISCNRPASLKETFVNPGEIGTFEFWITAPEQQGDFKEHFNLLLEGVSWFPTTGLYFPVKVIPHQYYGQFTSEKFYTSNEYGQIVRRDDLNNNRRYYVVYSIKNLGSETWTKSGSNPVRLGSINNSNSPLCDSSWLSCHRPTRLKEDVVTPGQTGTFEFWIKTGFDNNGKNYLETYKLLIENVRWFDFPTVGTNFEMNTPDSAWALVSQISYTDSTESQQSPTNNLKLNEEKFVVVKAKNLSGTTWSKSGKYPIHLATNSPRNASSPVCHEGWVACNRPSGIEESTVKPGGTATFKFWVRGKDVKTNYNENYVLVSENNYWLGNAGLTFHYRVK